MVKDFDELTNSLVAVESIARCIEKEFFDLSNIGRSSFYVLLRQKGMSFTTFLEYHTDLSDLLTLDISHDTNLVIRVRKAIMFIDHCILDVIESQADALVVGG